MNNTNNNNVIDVCEQSDCCKRPQNYRASVDVIESSDAWTVVADMPGSSSEAITISLEDNTLTIDAAVADRLAAKGRVRRQEYGVGDFHRSFRVGSGIDGDAIEATYRDGVLEVLLPKSSAVKGRRIYVRTA